MNILRKINDCVMNIKDKTLKSYLQLNIYNVLTFKIWGVKKTNKKAIELSQSNFCLARH